MAASYTSEGSQDRRVDLVAPGRSIVSLRDPGSYSDQVNDAGSGRGPLRARFGHLAGGRGGERIGRAAAAAASRAQPGSGQGDLLIASAGSDSTAPTRRSSGPGCSTSARRSGRSTIYTQQRWQPSTGTGSLEAARGNSHVTMADGTPLTGEQDVFGNVFTGRRVGERMPGRPTRGRGHAGPAAAGPGSLVGQPLVVGGMVRGRAGPGARWSGPAGPGRGGPVPGGRTAAGADLDRRRGCTSPLSTEPSQPSGCDGSAACLTGSLEVRTALP